MAASIGDDGEAGTVSPGLIWQVWYRHDRPRAVPAQVLALAARCQATQQPSRRTLPTPCPPPQAIGKNKGKKAQMVLFPSLKGGARHDDGNEDATRPGRPVP